MLNEEHDDDAINFMLEFRKFLRLQSVIVYFVNRKLLNFSERCSFSNNEVIVCKKCLRLSA